MNLGQVKAKMLATYAHSLDSIDLSMVEGQIVLKQVMQAHDFRFGHKVCGPTIMRLVDVAGFCVLCPELDDQEDAVTVHLNVDFLSPCDTQVLYCQATPIKLGRRLCTVEAKVYDDQQALCACARLIYARITHSSTNP